MLKDDKRNSKGSLPPSLLKKKKNLSLPSTTSQHSLFPLYTKKKSPFFLPFLKLATNMHKTSTLLPSFAHSMAKPYLLSFLPEMASPLLIFSMAIYNHLRVYSCCSWLAAAWREPRHRV